jgi:hypothetical protein
MQKIVAAMLLLTLVFNGLAAAQASPAGQSGEVYFPETGHSISGEFLAEYQRAADPQRLYGLPITSVFVDASTGRQVQYFERARFDLIPQSASAPARIERFPLGLHLYQPERSQPFEQADRRLRPVFCRKFEGPGGAFPVCHAFLDFYQKYGGVEQFGAPLSGLRMQQGRIVQYFENVSLEWWPERPAGERVQLASLGRRFLELRAHEWPHQAPENRPQQVLALEVYAQPATPVTALQDEQELVILVADQNRQPVAGARLGLRVSLPDGSQLAFDLPSLTDSQGSARFRFPFRTTVPGTILIETWAAFSGLTGSDQSTFRAWY